MIKVSTPGRICLFGEHQDYLGLPVIAAAISLRITFEGSDKGGDHFKINMPDINETEIIDLRNQIVYSKERDYIRSSIKVLQNAGFTFSQGIECEVKSEIPINAGTSSSSAMVVSWINLLSRLSDQARVLSAHEIAEFAYKAEVLEFGEPGGMMDHYSTAWGGIIGINSFPEIKTKTYDAKPGAFVLGNSKEPKDTKTILARVKDGVITIQKKLKRVDTNFSLQTVSVDKLQKYKKHLEDSEYQLLTGTIVNRDLTSDADKLLDMDQFDEQIFGNMLFKHHTILRDFQKISTPKIDRMIEAAMGAGALGAKINGSGGGGCMFAYAPKNTKAVYDAIKRISGEAYIISIADGSKFTDEF